MKRWPKKPLGEVCDLVNGAPFKPSDWDGSGLPIIRIQNLNDRAKPFNYTSKTLPDKFRVRTGDTLLSWSGTPGTSFGCFRWNGPEGWLNQHIFNVRLHSNVLPPFFIYQVNSKLEEIIGKAHGGVGLQHITKSALSSVMITVPTLPEQERIVNLLDEADELRKLRIQADRRTAALLPSLFDDMFGDPATNPHGYRKASLGELCEFVNGAPFKPSDWDGSGLPIVRIQNLNDSAKPFNYTSKQLHEKFRVRPGDTLLSWSGTPGTSFGCFRWGGPEGWLNQHIFNVKLRTDLDDVFFIQSVNVRLHELIARAHGGVGLQHVTKGTLNAVEMLVPPLPLQKNFAQRVTEIRELEAIQTASRLRLDALFQSILHRAFKGELTGGTEVVKLQSSPEFIRSVLAAEIVARMHSDRTFGQVKLQKVIHLAEYIVPIVEIASEPERFAAGPHEPKLIAQVETKMKDCDWFEAVPRADGYGNEYRPLAKAGGHREYFEKLWPKQATAIRRLIDEMKTWKTERCERFATVYAAWNDLLIWGKQTDDAAILDQVLNHWNTAKQRIPKASWVETLTWMKREGYVPTGFGRATAAKPQAELFPS